MSNDDMSQRAIQELFLLFQKIRLRPGMYLGNDDPERFMIFMTGLQVACQIFGVDIHRATNDTYEKVITEYGWDIEISGESLLAQMRRSGSDDHIILNTLIDVEIEVLRRHYNLK